MPEESISKTTASAVADIYLASLSPRRRELLAQIGVRFEQFSVDIDEDPLPAEDPLLYVQRMAKEKAIAAWATLLDSGQPLRPLLCADTTVVFEGEILGKPASEEQAVANLLRLSGSAHQVISAVCIYDGDKLESLSCVSQVLFASIDEARARRYWATGEPQDKAGGYGIQGLGSVFVADLQGSYSNVVGLPLAETVQLLEKFDIPYWQDAPEG